MSSYQCTFIHCEHHRAAVKVHTRKKSKSISNMFTCLLVMTPCGKNSKGDIWILIERATSIARFWAQPLLGIHGSTYQDFKKYCIKFGATLDKYTAKIDYYFKPLSLSKLNFNISLFKIEVSLIAIVFYKQKHITFQHEYYEAFASTFCLTSILLHWAHLSFMTDN